jgi:DNA-binding phage protein
MGKDGAEQFRTHVRDAAANFGQRKLAASAGISREALRAILKGATQPRDKTAGKLLRAITAIRSNVGAQVSC